MISSKETLCERCISIKQLDKETQNTVMVESSKSINDLPREILQYIFSLIPPYRDIRHCKLVCKLWLILIDDLLARRKGKYIKALLEMSVFWQECVQEPWSMVAARYSHATCYYKDGLYVFGGSTNNNTTFNDLWKFELGTRRWIRPLVTGTYPVPKACATFVPYKNHLILFGGWNNPPFYNFDQSVRLNNQVHLYNVINNNWIELDTVNPPNSVAGHSATIHGDFMVVFGGHRLLNNSNEVWALDLKTSSWWKPETTTPLPDPRYGQTQVYIDDNNILIIGGCGGPNKILSDIWLLSFSFNRNELWKWTKIVVKNSDSSPPHVWSHTGCKVEDHIVFLGKCSETRAIPMSSTGHSRIASQDGNLQTKNILLNSNHLHKTGNFSKMASSRLGVKRCQLCGSTLSENDAARKNFNDHFDSPSLTRLTNILRNTTMPSVKPNSLRNRQRQLEGCYRMEQRIRTLSKTPMNRPVLETTKQLNRTVNSSMAIYLLDISRIIENHEAKWTIVPQRASNGSPPDTMFYSMIFTGAEVVVFGGIRKEAFFAPLSPNSNQLSNSVHILSYKPFI